MRDDSHIDRKSQSLLSLGLPAGGTPRQRDRSALTPDTGGSDAGERHRAARAKREAPSPLLEALAAMEGFEAKPTGPGESGAGAKPSEPGSRSRWSLRNLFSSTQRLEEPEPAPAWRAPPSPTQPAAVPADAAHEPRESADAFADEVRGRMDLAGGPEWRPLIDPMQVVGGVTRSVPLIAAMTLMGAAIGIMMALSTPKKYEAVAKLLVDPRDFKVSDRDLTEGGLPQDATLALIENQVDIITSNAVLGRVVDELGLDKNPEFNGQRGGAGLGDVLGALRSLLSSGEPGGEDRRRALAVAALGESLNVERDAKRFTVTVSVKTEDAGNSADIVNAINREYLTRKAALQKETVGRAAGELASRLDELRADLEKAERAAEQYRAEHDLIDAQGRLISDDELVKLNDQLATARAHTIELNARAASARAVRLDAVIGAGLPEELTSSVMSELRSQYAAIKQQADQLSVRVGPRHPQYLAMQAQLEGARAQIANEVQRVVRSVQTELQRAVQQEQDLAARLAQLKVRATDVNADLVTMRQLEREAAAKRNVYENYLLRAKEASEQSGIDTANVTVISPAEPPLESIGPSRAVIVAAGAVVGFIVGIGLGMLRGIYASLRDGARPSRRRVLSAPAPAVMAAPVPPKVEEKTPSEPLAPESAPPPGPTLRQARVEAARRAVDAVRARVGSDAAPPAEPRASARPADEAVLSAARRDRAARVDRVERGEPARPAQHRPRETEEPRPLATVDRAARTDAASAVPFEREAAGPVDAVAARDEEAGMNPLVRLMRRMRLPSVAVAGSGDGTGISSENAPANDAPNQEEQQAMYPYPHQPYAAPQPNGQPQQAAPHPYPVQAWPQPAAPSYPQAGWPQAASYAPAAHFQPQHPLQPYPPVYAAAPAGAQPTAYPYPQPPHGWQPQPGGAYAYPPALAAPHPAQPAAWPHGHAGQPDPRAESREMSPIEEVRESLREFREAILDLAADRARRRFS